MLFMKIDFKILYSQYPQGYNEAINIYIGSCVWNNDESTGLL